ARSPVSSSTFRRVPPHWPHPPRPSPATASRSAAPSPAARSTQPDRATRPPSHSHTSPSKRSSIHVELDSRRQQVYRHHIEPHRHILPQLLRKSSQVSPRHPPQHI